MRISWIWSYLYSIFYETRTCIDKKSDCIPEQCLDGIHYSLFYCRETCGICNDTIFGVPQERLNDHFAQARFNASRIFMYHNVYRTMRAEVKRKCHNRHSLCSYWAAYGECQTNAGFMKHECGPACLDCSYHEPNHCHTPDSDDIMQHNQLQQYMKEVAQSSGGSFLSDNIIQFEDFLSPVECNGLIEFVESSNRFEISTIVDRSSNETSLAQSTRRTSQTLWCVHGCPQQVLVRSLIDRVSQVLSIPSDNFEHVQFLKYQKGNYYTEHSDFVPEMVDSLAGPRILTFFFYLNDVEEGGETSFSQQDIAVKPKAGRAVLWPNVLNENLLERDNSTRHEARPVRGEIVKYAGNLWIHLRSFQGPYRRHCW